MNVTNKYIDDLIGDMTALVVKQARNMADDIERQELPTTGPQALRMLARCLEKGPRHD